LPVDLSEDRTSGLRDRLLQISRLLSSL